MLGLRRGGPSAARQALRARSQEAGEGPGGGEGLRRPAQHDVPRREGAGRALLKYAYRDRKAKKRNFRRLWIIRINAAARAEGLSYNQFVAGCRKAGIELDRKVLAELAVNDPAAFSKIAEQAKAALAS